MRLPPKPTKVEDVGLRKWLDDSSRIHNNHGYDYFVEMLNSEMHYTKSQIALEFRVSRDTIYNWIALLDKERNSENSSN